MDRVARRNVVVRARADQVALDGVAGRARAREQNTAPCVAGDDVAGASESSDRVVRRSHPDAVTQMHLKCDLSLLVPQV